MSQQTDEQKQKNPSDGGLYSVTTIWAEPSFKPMIGVSVVVMALIIVIIWNPTLMGPGDGEITLYTYLVTALTFVIVGLGFVYDYLVERNTRRITEGGGSQ